MVMIFVFNSEAIIYFNHFMV